MLGELERRITSILADGLSARTHLSVVQAPRRDSLTPGEGQVRVGVSEVAGGGSFAREQFGFANPERTRLRRELPLRFVTRVELRQRPAGGSAPQVSAARTLILEDMSLVAHRLGEESVLDGSAFATAAPDPGFDVQSFVLARGQLEPEIRDNLLEGSLSYDGLARIWPSGISREGGPIRAIDALVTPLPASFAVEDPRVRIGSTTRIRIRGIDGLRLAESGSGPRQPLRLAVRVVSDLPPADRGAILSGSDGPETGLRIVPVTPPETQIQYRAPAGDPGATRVELVAVHLATPDDRRGIFIGSAVIHLDPEET